MWAVAAASHYDLNFQTFSQNYYYFVLIWSIHTEGKAEYQRNFDLGDLEPYPDPICRLNPDPKFLKFLILPKHSDPQTK